MTITEEPASLAAMAAGRPHAPDPMMTTSASRCHWVGACWACAEAELSRSLGYGTYKVTVRDASNLHGQAVFSMFTWDYARPNESNGEMDMEYNYWEEEKENFQCGLPPFYGQNIMRVIMPSATLIHSLRWEPGRAVFRTARILAPSANPLAEHAFTSNVPTHGMESFRMCLYLRRNHPLTFREDPEVVIENFQYLP